MHEMARSTSAILTFGLPAGSCMLPSFREQRVSIRVGCTRIEFSGHCRDRQTRSFAAVMRHGSTANSGSAFYFDLLSFVRFHCLVRTPSCRHNPLTATALKLLCRAGKARAL